MADLPPPTDPQARKAAIREQARKNRVAQKNKDEVSRAICAAFVALPAYRNARTVMWYVDAGSEVRTRHTLPEALTHGKRVVVPWCVVETNELELFHLEDMSELETGMYKILEPKKDLRELAAKRVDVKDLDLIMVPGVAFGESRSARRRAVVRESGAPIPKFPGARTCGVSAATQRGVAQSPARGRRGSAGRG